MVEDGVVEARDTEHNDRADGYATKGIKEHGIAEVGAMNWLATRHRIYVGFMRIVRSVEARSCALRLRSAMKLLRLI